MPTNPLSRFLVTIAAVPGQVTHKQVIFGSLVPGRSYTVERSDDLASASWSSLTHTTVVDNGGQRTVTDTGATVGRQLYRVKVEKP